MSKIDTNSWSLILPQVDWRNWAHPSSVVENPELSVDEKKSLLASWASDANAIPNFPALRRLKSGEIVLLDEIFKALKKLDGITDAPPFPKGQTSQGDVRVQRRKERRQAFRWRWWDRRNDDDSGPTAAAPAAPLPPIPSPEAAAAVAA